jgi:hypothetical protein
MRVTVCVQERPRVTTLPTGTVRWKSFNYWAIRPICDNKSPYNGDESSVWKATYRAVTGISLLHIPDVGVVRWVIRTPKGASP